MFKDNHDNSRDSSNCGCEHRSSGTKNQIEHPDAKPTQVYTGHRDLDEFLVECLETFHSKGHDYRQGNDDLLHNFRTVGQTIGIPMEKAWATYFYKHYSALMTFIKEGGQSESEPIEDRIKDMIVYLLLFRRMVQEMKVMSRPLNNSVEVPIGEIGVVTVDKSQVIRLLGDEIKRQDAPDSRRLWINEEELTKAIAETETLLPRRE